MSLIKTDLSALDLLLLREQKKATSVGTSIPPYSKLRAELLKQRAKKQEVLNLKIETLCTNIFAQLSSLMKKDPTEFFDEDDCVLKYEVDIPWQEEWLDDDVETQLHETLLEKLKTMGYSDCEIYTSYQDDLQKVEFAFIVEVSLEEEKQ